MKPNSQKIKTMMEIPLQNKKELQALFRIINYLIKFSSSTVDVCEAPRQLISAKTEWTWNADDQKLFNKASFIIKADTCMKFYNKTKPLYLETDALGVGLGTSLLQTRNGTSHPRDMAPDKYILRPITFTSKRVSSAQKGHSNIEREASGILHDL